MSCIVGLIDNGRVYIACDSYASTDDGELRPIEANKIIKNKNYLIGYSGSVRTGQLLDPFYFTPPDDIKEFPDAIREYLYAKGSVAFSELQLQMQTCNFLIGFKGKLYEILMDFQLNTVVGNYSSVGSGSPYAMGAMSVLDLSKKINPVQKLELAIRAACKFHVSCGLPFRYQYI